MGKKKGSKKDSPTEIRALQFHIVELVGKVRALDSRLRNLITYVEYVAGNLDVSVDYAEYLGEIIAKHQTQQTIGGSIVPSERTPTFLEYRKLRGIKDDIEILF